MEVDILDFRVPVESNKTVFVWDIEPSHTEAHIYGELHRVFLAFGPLYLLKVCPNAALHPPGFYALAKFYSAAQASTAQRLTDGRSLFQSAPLKVRLSSGRTPHFLCDAGRPLSHAHCLELANHCLGFNGWTSDIITLKELTNEEEEEEEEEEQEEQGGGRRRRLRFGCLLRLSFPRHGRTTRAAAVMEDSFTCTGPDVLLHRRCRLQKLVQQKALVQAFGSVLLIVFGNGKVMVEVKQTSDQLPEQTEGVIQVSEFTPDEEDDDDDDEDEEWDLTVS